MIISEDSTNTLLWLALGGYILVLALVVPLLAFRNFNGYNSIVLGILIFTILLGISLANRLILNVEGLSAVVLNLSWLTLLYQTGVIAEWWNSMFGRRRKE